MKCIEKENIVLLAENHGKNENVHNMYSIIKKIIKIIIWTIFFAVWSSCLFIGGEIGMIAVVIGILVLIVSSI